jgi:hypothetical protein
MRTDLVQVALTLNATKRGPIQLVTPKLKNPLLEIWIPDQTVTVPVGQRKIIFQFDIDKTLYGVIRKIANFPSYSNAKTTGVPDELYWYIDQISQYDKPITVCLGEPNSLTPVLKFFKTQVRWEAKNNGDADHPYRIINMGKVGSIEDRDVIEQLAFQGVF